MQGKEEKIMMEMANYVIASQPPIGEPRRRRSFNIGNGCPTSKLFFAIEMFVEYST